jgi:hypothetical protein
MKIPNANDSSAMFAGRVALVTGASHGIGAATARLLDMPQAALGGEGIDCCTALASAGNVAMPAPPNTRPPSQPQRPGTSAGAGERDTDVRTV